MNQADTPLTSEGPHAGSSLFLTLARWIDRLNDHVGRAVAWLTAVLVAVTTADVALRYVFNTSFVFVQELEWHLFAVIFLCAAGFTHLKDGHVRVDIFYSRFSPQHRAWVNFVFALLFLFPTCFLLIKTSLPFIERSWLVLEGSPDPGGLPARYILKTAIPIGFFLLALQGVSQTIKNAHLLFGKKTDMASTDNP
ncbi:MAG: TRAP transporter small permease subunit [Deltaproteobacteria bacterium]|nr:TRAP transporter small permease subunit [Deltaproteobacteria bacterium]